MTKNRAPGDHQMHELSICENVIQTIEAEAKRQAFHRVKMVCLEIGQFSCVEPESLKFCFDVVSKNSIAEGSTLLIERPPGVVRCDYCQKSYAMETRYQPCPDCGSYQLQVESGDEMKIKELEVV